MDETLFLTINIVDKFLERQVVVRKKLQLVGVTAMLLACKYEEVSVPIVDDFILISDNAYTRKEVLDMVIFLSFLFRSKLAPCHALLTVLNVHMCLQEKLLLNTLQFNMSVPTPYVFMRRFLKAAQSDKKVRFTDNHLIWI